MVAAHVDSNFSSFVRVGPGIAMDPKEKVIGKDLIKSLLIKCAQEKATQGIQDGGDASNEPRWPMPEMVGFYGRPSIPLLPVVHPSSEDLAVKKLVCSPDLPIPAFSGDTQEKTTESVRCPVCQKMYTSKSAFQAHQRTHSKDSEDPYRCNICAKTFAVPARLTRHYRTHTGEKPFRCEFCNKSFSVKENLSVHRRIHTKERPYKCEVCSRAFEHSGKLHRHMRIHTGERPHKCNVCSKTFIQSGQLVIHMRTHTGEKPYVCNVCQKGFTCSKQLKVHSRTHTGEKPYSCEICGKSFGYNHVLKLHQVAHFGEKVYKCTICNATFNSKKSMEAHIKSHSESAQHPPQPPTPPASNPSSESSCSSTISDKENLKMGAATLEETRDVNYYVYSRGGISPTYLQTNYPISSAGVELLAAAATARESVEMYGPNNQDLVFSFVKTTPQALGYFPAPHCDPPLSAGDDIRKRVEEALVLENYPEEGARVVTPPFSNPASPSASPPASPDPELSLPPRKRSRMIQKSMEESLDLSPVRYSVIQYARAS